jgi:GntR family transcriptional regulator, transcriptional repressor for pyruvate dehydrogenase complex
MDVEQIKSERLFEAISRQIGEQIHSGRLKAGEKLPNERELASRFAVSRHALREALRSLESIGQLEFRKGATGGAFVVSGNPEPLAKIMQGMVNAGGVRIEHLTEARLAIETSIIVLACQTANEADLQALDQNVDDAERETLAGNLKAKSQLNIEFHVRLAELTGNPILIMMMKSLMSLLRDLIAEVGSVTSIDVIASRRRFLRHLHNRNVSKATAEMERHLTTLHEHYIAVSKRSRATRGRNHGRQ